MGIERHDAERRQDWVLRVLRQFDAPVTIILTYDRVLDPGAICHFDLGALGYGIVLAAWNRGLGAATSGQGLSCSDIVREIAGVPDDEVIMTAIAMGYPNDDFAANTVKSDRAPNEEFVGYVGFEDLNTLSRQWLLMPPTFSLISVPSNSPNEKGPPNGAAQISNVAVALVYSAAAAVSANIVPT